METQKQKIFNGVKDTNDIKITSIKNEEGGQGSKEKERDEKMEEFLAETGKDANNPIFIPTDGQYKPKGLIKILNSLAVFLLVFLIGGAGGVWMEQTVMPRLAAQSPFNNYAFFKSINDRTSIINQTNNVTISDDSALLESVRKVSPSVVKITANYIFKEKPPAKKKANAPALKTSVENRNLNGVIIASDGLILTRDPQNFKTDLAKNDFTEVNYIVSYGGKEFTVSGSENITFYDSVDKATAGTEKGNLVILKIKAENLPVVALGDSTNAEVGQRVVALGNNLFSGIISERSANGMISIDNYPAASYFGSGPVIDNKGKVVGVNFIDKNDRAGNSFIGVDEFKNFIRQVIGS